MVFLIFEIFFMCWNMIEFYKKKKKNTSEFVLNDSF